MIRFFIVIPIFLIVLISLVGVYLQPNDFKKCSEAPNANIAGCESADALVVLSGGDTHARVDKSIDLFNKGWSSKIVFSGAAQDKSGPSNAKAMKTRAVNAGIDADRIILDETSESTKENAINSCTIFKTEKISNAIIVTSGYHQRRAVLEFHNYCDSVGLRNYPESQDKDWSFWWWTNYRGWSLAISELAKNIELSLGVNK
jgi:uncharacterized SAM-binding protein YcdF (DUF218 family)